MTSPPPAYDSVLLISFGGPNRMEDVRPFLANVVRGRPVPPSRLEEVVHHYEIIGGRSPLNELTFRQADGLRALLDRQGLVRAGRPHPFARKQLEGPFVARWRRPGLGRRRQGGENEGQDQQTTTMHLLLLSSEGGDLEAPSPFL